LAEKQQETKGDSNKTLQSNRYEKPKKALFTQRDDGGIVNGNTTSTVTTNRQPSNGRRLSKPPFEQNKSTNHPKRPLIKDRKAKDNSELDTHHMTKKKSEMNLSSKATATASATASAGLPNNQPKDHPHELMSESGKQSRKNVHLKPTNGVTENLVSILKDQPQNFKDLDKSVDIPECPSGVDNPRASVNSVNSQKPIKRIDPEMEVLRKPTTTKFGRCSERKYKVAETALNGPTDGATPSQFITDQYGGVMEHFTESQRQYLGACTGAMAVCQNQTDRYDPCKTISMERDHDYGRPYVFASGSGEEGDTSTALCYPHGKPPNLSLAEETSSEGIPKRDYFLENVVVVFVCFYHQPGRNYHGLIATVSRGSVLFDLASQTKTWVQTSVSSKITHAVPLLFCTMSVQALMKKHLGILSFQVTEEKLTDTSLATERHISIPQPNDPKSQPPSNSENPLIKSEPIACDEDELPCITNVYSLATSPLREYENINLWNSFPFSDTNPMSAIPDTKHVELLHATTHETTPCAINSSPVLNLAPPAVEQPSQCSSPQKKLEPSDGERQQHDMKIECKENDPLEIDADLPQEGSPTTPTPRRKRSPSTKRKRVPCNRCANCQAADCRKCMYCLDMKKYGGRGKMKQKCRYRQCQTFKKGRSDTEAVSAADDSSVFMAELCDNLVKPELQNSDTNITAQIDAGKKQVIPKECGSSFSSNGTGDSASLIKILDCGTCINCVDKTRFGGPGTRKQRCIRKPKGMSLICLESELLKVNRDADSFAKTGQPVEPTPPPVECDDLTRKEASNTAVNGKTPLTVTEEDQGLTSHNPGKLKWFLLLAKLVRRKPPSSLS